MAHALIDGYNLLGVFHKNLERAREELIHRLERYCSMKGHDLTIVFDGWKEGEPFESVIRQGTVTVIYSKRGETADAVIERILRERKKAWIVITSDRAVADFAWGMGYASINSQEFERKLESSGKRDPSDMLDEEDLSKTQRKGNPRMPNKRQKLKIKALEKL
jgi:predicted RNA-binding protein with PIN domain